LPLLSFFAVDANLKDFTSQAQAVQLAGNGPWEFFRAFRTNEIDYEQFYRTLPVEEAGRLVKQQIARGDASVFTGNVRAPFERTVVAPGAEKKLNVVMISVESLSGDFMAAFGNTKGITPALDALAGDSLFFTQLYSTGTRTVRGLEALSIGIPPTPGYSVVKRPNNENLFTIGSVFKSKGYEPIYFYGGYGYFDNMNYFFSNNGYTVIDRVGLAKEEIHHETIWGVADEDLFTLTLRELDGRYARKQPFFAQVMTTSNHRPYTYPAGRIDIPSGTGRDGAVKYTDWAIGDFIRRARTKPWFDDTVFVIVADHCASSRGTTDIPIERFHIPMLIYAPKHIPARRVETVASQIDVPPTILALLNMSYASRFFGQDILTAGQKYQRTLMANYQTVAYLEDGVLVELRPKGRVRVVDAVSGQPRGDEATNKRYVDAAIAYYQSASQAFRNGGLKLTH
jgi:phosphoglycerol transferase MdoB-like AlkP superfamily enzyme